MTYLKSITVRRRYRGITGPASYAKQTAENIGRILYENQESREQLFPLLKTMEAISCDIANGVYPHPTTK